MKSPGRNSHLDSFIRGSRPEFEEKLATLVEIPSISMDPSCGPDIVKCGEVAVDYLKAVGAQATLSPTPGNPVVFGSLINDPKFPTVTIYNHLDVQPADASEWHKAPFTFYKHGEQVGNVYQFASG